MRCDNERPNKIVWITWERQIRNRSMAKALEVPLFEIVSLRSRVIRYIYCICRTFTIVINRKPLVVICQNPSVVLTCFLLFLRAIYSFKVVIDAHYGGVEAYNGSKIFQWVLGYCNNGADLVIVTNKEHARYLKRLGAKIFVCPDPLPDLSEFRVKSGVIPRKVFFICSFDPDEPYIEVFEAAKSLKNNGFSFFVSSDYKKANVIPADYPLVTFLGFVSEREFYNHLFSSELVIDLTENENCLVCGAYESLAAGKPVILSDQKVLRQYFTGGAVFTENSCKAIEDAVKNAYANKQKLRDECVAWVKENRHEMHSRLQSLREILLSL